MKLFGAERFTGDHRAVSAVEYAIMAAALGIVLITIFTNFAVKFSVLFARAQPAFSR